MPDPQLLDFNDPRADAAQLRAAGYVGVMRYLRDWDAPEYRLERDEALRYRAAGLKLGVVWQNADSSELWEPTGPRADLDPGFDVGAAIAEEARDQLTARAGRSGLPFGIAVDQPNVSEQGPRPLSVAIAALRGARSVVGRDRLGMYGCGDAVRRVMQLDNPPVGWYWLSWLLDGIYWDPPRERTKLSSLPGKIALLQWGNSDQDDELPRFGIEGYVGHDRGTPGVELPIWHAS